MSIAVKMDDLDLRMAWGVWGWVISVMVVLVVLFVRWLVEESAMLWDSLG